MLGFFKDLWAMWKHRDQLGYVKEIGEAVKEELAKTATDARPIWKTYRFWSGLLMILGVVVALVFGVVSIEHVITPALVVAIGTVIAGIVQILMAKGQAKTEKMIAAAATQTNQLVQSLRAANMQ